MPALSELNAYLWKCWRDTRRTFLIFAGAILANSVFGLYVYFDPWGWIAAKAEWPRLLWNSTAQAMMLTMLGATPIVGFLLGAQGVGTEFERRTADFFLTRPRSRAYFLWTSWAFGAAQMMAMVFLSWTMIWLAPYDGAPPRNVYTLAGMCVVALTIYSVTYLMTTLARNSSYGVCLGVLVFMAYTGLYVWLKLWYEVNIPFLFALVFSSGRAGKEIQEASLLATFSNPEMLGWLAVCGALIFAAQKVFERAEV
jgi:ABC-type transport system involved in multi-copper enzyme maturation permease subunit